MVTLNAPKLTAESQLNACSGTVYINALTMLPANERYQHDAIALHVLLVHRITGEELLLDLLTPCDDFATVLSVVRLHFPSGRWLFGESWAAATPEAPHLAAAA